MADDLTTEETVPEAIAHAKQAIFYAHGGAALTDAISHDQSYPISDLIADLLHLAEDRGHTSDDVIAQAIRHYEAERAD
jgi:hypothetical protein